MLKVDDNSWNAGPTLPNIILNPQIVNDPKRIIYVSYLIGGDDGSKTLSRLYSFSNNIGNCDLMKSIPRHNVMKELSSARKSFAAVVIPDKNFFQNCKL